MWGPEGWKKVVVCVVSDGRNKVNKRTLQVLSLVRSLGNYTAPYFVLMIARRWVSIKKVLPRTPSEAKT